MSQSLQGWCVKDGGSNNNDWSPDRSLKSGVSLQLGGLNNNSYLMVISGRDFDSRIGLSDDGYGEDMCVLDTLDTRDDRKEMDRKM